MMDGATWPERFHGPTVILARYWQCDHLNSTLAPVQYVANQEASLCVAEGCARYLPTMLDCPPLLIPAMAALCCPGCGAHFIKTRTRACDTVIHRACGARAHIAAITTNLDIQAWVNAGIDCVQAHRDAAQAARAAQEARTMASLRQRAAEVPAADAPLVVSVALREEDRRELTEIVLRRFVRESEMDESLLTCWTRALLQPMPPRDTGRELVPCGFCALQTRRKKTDWRICERFAAHKGGDRVLACRGDVCRAKWTRCIQCRRMECH